MDRRNLVRLAPGAVLLIFSLGCALSGEPSPAAPALAAVTATSHTYLPFVSQGTPSPTGGLLQAVDFEYLGAFRLPEGGERPLTFAYGGNAMTFNPAGDPDGAVDGFPGSLFITGHDRLPYGELTDGSQVAEVSIPVPAALQTIGSLNRAAFLQDFADVSAGHFTGLDEIPRLGLLYLNTPATGPLLHLAWGQHLQPDPPAASHAWFSPNLAVPNFQGEWFIGDQGLDSVNGYLFEIPTWWADAYASGRYIGTGRYRDGGWSGMGPALFAYRPWIDEDGTPAAPGARLPEIVLLLYESSAISENFEHALANYQHPDEWEGGAWVTTNSSKTAVIFAGNKSLGDKYWYGYINPAGPQYPCVDDDFVGQFPVCRLADGSDCPAEDLVECSGHNDYRGWWSTRWDAQIILYNPADLQRVAAGEIASWEPQPYASLTIDEHLFFNPTGIEADMIGNGEQRRFLIGDVAYDRAHDLLYILELFADEAAPIVHAWKLH